MWLLISLAVLSLPILDIASLVVVGGRIGVVPTVAAVVLAFIAGGILVRSQRFTLLQQDAGRRRVSGKGGVRWRLRPRRRRPVDVSRLSF